ncbi:unnamed protein product [Paramecium octaurelia]|uniref:Uncharacterized protein n=1 Tax=Paramecium octaurelia TaxID=43137 RepID=A0A8S1TVJ0_PAROT|nr:unnamed protein product [Paramecium octaurelia]
MIIEQLHSQDPGLKRKNLLSNGSHQDSLPYFLSL